MGETELSVVGTVTGRIQSLKPNNSSISSIRELLQDASSLVIGPDLAAAGYKLLMVISHHFQSMYGSYEGDKVLWNNYQMTPEDLRTIQYVEDDTRIAQEVDRRLSEYLQLHDQTTIGTVLNPVEKLKEETT